jgi:hypothetical protein
MNDHELAPAGIEPLTQPPPGWSNSTDTVHAPTFQTPPVDMSVAGWSNAGPYATGALAGSPGSWTPAGSWGPYSLATLAPITASPLTAWTTGQCVILGDNSQAHWNGTIWAAGAA